MIFLKVNDKQYTNFSNASVSFSMDTFAREFRFSAVGSGGTPLPFKGGEACQVFIGEKQQVLNGFIDIVDISYDAGSHNIEILGRGRAADIADSTLDRLEINPPISLQLIIEKVIDQLKVDIKVNDLVGDIDPFGKVKTEVSFGSFNKAEDSLGASTGDGAFDFIETLSRKRQVILNENGDGDIDIIRTGTDTYQQKLQNIISSDSNNILRASVSYDLSGIYRKYIIRSQKNTNAVQFGSDVKSVVDQCKTITDEKLRLGRQFAFMAEKASESDDLQKRLDWELLIRRARSRLYTVTFVGHKTHFDEEWITNKLIRVNDEFMGIDEFMLINRVTFTESLEGEITELSLIDKNAYNPNPSAPLSVGVGEPFVE